MGLNQTARFVPEWAIIFKRVGPTPDFGELRSVGRITTSTFAPEPLEAPVLVDKAAMVQATVALLAEEQGAEDAPAEESPEDSLPGEPDSAFGFHEAEPEKEAPKPRSKRNKK